LAVDKIQPGPRICQECSSTFNISNEMEVETLHRFKPNSAGVPTSGGEPRERSYDVINASTNYESSGSDGEHNFDQDEIDMFEDEEFGAVGEMLSPTISRYQSKLASAMTPAHEKEAAIRASDGYFDAVPLGTTGDVSSLEESQESLNSWASERPTPSSSSQDEGPGNSGQRLAEDTICFGDTDVDASKTTCKDFAPGSLVSTAEEQEAKNAKADQIGRDEHHAEKGYNYSIGNNPTESEWNARFGNRPRLSAHHRPTEDSVMSYTRALSMASSLGDDDRFEHIKKMANNRSKAFWDSIPSPNLHFHLPSMPSLSKVLNVFPSGSSSTVEETKQISEKALNKSGNGGRLSSAVSVYPTFTRAIELLEGDLVVLGGYRGSVLRQKKKPSERIWPPSLKCMADLGTVNVAVGFDEDSEDKAAEEIEADGMIKNFGPIDVSRRLFKRLYSSSNVKSGKLRIHNYSYDWRLSPHRLAEEFLTFIERLECNSNKTPISQRGATIIAHSLGGLLTRYAVNKKPHLFSAVLYAGTPQKAINVLGPLKFNDTVMRSTRILTAQTNFSVRTSFALLPIDGKCFVDASTKEDLPVDFFNPEDWVKYRLSPCIEPSLPPANPPAPTKSFLETITSTIPIIGRRASAAPKNGDGSSNSSGSPSRTDSPSPRIDEGPSAIEKTSAMVPQLDTRDRSSSNAFKPNYLPITISRDKALEYLTRTLAEVKAFKLALEHRPEFTVANSYPPFSVLYGKSEPTVLACKVQGYDSIGCMDVYSDENLLFGSGDGVVLSKAAMLPMGYKAAKGGVVVTNRGHVTLLADLEAVGTALLAMSRAKKHGVGMGARRAWDNPEVDEQVKANYATA
jgi:hypothetical protein